MIKLINSKNASFSKNWAEISALILLILGFVISATSTNILASYIIIFFCGLIIGRAWFQRKKQIKIPSFVIIMGFLIGYLLGNYYQNNILLIIVFIIGTTLSYYLHEKKILK